MEHSVKIAVVDDETGMLDSLKFLLGREGVVILTFGSIQLKNIHH